jgi:hypothetical protein
MIRQIAGKKALLFKIAESGGKAFSGKKRLLKKGLPLLQAGSGSLWGRRHRSLIFPLWVVMALTTCFPYRPCGLCFTF